MAAGGVHLYKEMNVCLLVACTLLVHYGSAGKSRNSQTNSRTRLSDEARLVRDLKRGYSYVGTETRPVYNTTDTLNVQFGLALLNIYKMEEAPDGNYGDISLGVWYRYMWNDINLMWNQAEYGGIDHVRIPIKYIWRPDVVLYNGIGAGMEETLDALAVVSSDGSVLWIPRGKVQVRCDGFPKTSWWSPGADDPGYDYSCMIKFGSWTYDGFKLDPDFYNGLEEIDVSDLKAGPQPFDLVGHAGVKNVKYYPCCVEPYPDLTYTLNIKRK